MAWRRQPSIFTRRQSVVDGVIEMAFEHGYHRKGFHAASLDQHDADHVFDRIGEPARTERAGPAERTCRTITERALLCRIVDDRQAETKPLPRPHDLPERRNAALVAREKIRAHQIDRTMRQQARTMRAFIGVASHTAAAEQQARETKIVVGGGNKTATAALKALGFSEAARCRMIFHH